MPIFVAGSIHGVFDESKSELKSQPSDIKEIKSLAMNNACVKVHPDGTGAPQEGPPSIGKSRCGLTAKIRVIAADSDLPIARRLSPGQANDSPLARGVVDRERFAHPREASLFLIRKRTEINKNVVKRVFLALKYAFAKAAGIYHLLIKPRLEFLHTS